MATEDRFPTYGRFLCIMLLKMFAGGETIRDGGRIVHVITEKEKQKAGKALESLRVDVDAQPPEIRRLLNG